MTVHWLIKSILTRLDLLQRLRNLKLFLNMKDHNSRISLLKDQSPLLISQPTKDLPIQVNLRTLEEFPLTRQQLIKWATIKPIRSIMDLMTFFIDWILIRAVPIAALSFIKAYLALYAIPTRMFDSSYNWLIY